MKKKCLACYKDLESESLHLYHSHCCKKIFLKTEPPQIDFGIDDLDKLALQSFNKHLGVTGVQPKISLGINKKNDPKNRLMITDLWGSYILKPPTKQFSQMSLIEDVTMHMANYCSINTAKHCLVELKDGTLSYLTKRFDRDDKGNKLAVEDLCQLSGLLTESKYNSSTEKAGKIILQYSSQGGLDAIRFFDLIFFCYLTGNADMHLKNFSLIKNTFNEIVLSPAYDLLSTKLLIPDDKEEVALSINGKKNKLHKKDFLALGKNLGITEIVMEKSFKRILDSVLKSFFIIDHSFLSEELKKSYKDLIQKRVHSAYF